MRSLITAGPTGTLAGVFVWAILLLPLARMLPDSWHLPKRIAAGVVGTNRWTAGDSMMASYAPEAWQRIAYGAELETTTRKALDACRRVAAKTEKPQRCSV